MGASLVAQMVKNLLAMQETWVPCVSRGLQLSQKSDLRRFCVDFGTQLIISMNSRISS